MQRLGGGALIPLDVRVIAATHRDLEREVQPNLVCIDTVVRRAMALLILSTLAVWLIVTTWSVTMWVFVIAAGVVLGGLVLGALARA